MEAVSKLTNFARFPAAAVSGALSLTAQEADRVSSLSVSVKAQKDGRCPKASSGSQHYLYPSLLRVLPSSSDLWGTK